MAKLFASPAENKAEIAKIFQIEEEKVAKLRGELKKWINEKNPVLPEKLFDEQFQEVLLLRNKFDLDKTKNAIDAYLNCIKKYPEMFEMIGIDIKPSKEIAYAVPCYKLAPNLERIAILKLRDEPIDYNDFDIDRCFLTAVTQGILMVNYDYVASVRIIADFNNFTLKHILKVTPTVLKKLLYLYENLIKMRLSGIEILNAPGIIGGLLQLLKMVMKPKLFARITVHKDFESLYRNVDKEYLPSDYGGDLESVAEIMQLVDEAVDGNPHIYEEVRKIARKSREDDLSKVNSCHESFRQLDVD